MSQRAMRKAKGVSVSSRLSKFLYRVHENQATRLGLRKASHKGAHESQASDGFDLYAKKKHSLDLKKEN